MYVTIKILTSAIIIAIISEVARRFPVYGGILAALPLVSLLSILWLSVQGESPEALSRFASGVLYGLPATAIMLAVIYLSLKHSLPLILALTLGLTSWGITLIVQNSAIKLISSFT
ncbi:DUF3147 family protein [Salipaludibacillus agaradhaerens]|uniref:DUF3147 family protein n=1 Tax=Salipaludibacillus agaradhaerens TaxID=76935 RepID=A0A9Q4G0N8_SALAG|nr:DUF3147 family protein [Salipaludibacillus agaradhaerens]UJW56291.1 DUF3147 family protein [Bacillus sp. A116_S68]MCR6098088.1 DUF3147 family protein [Salipaludibacillus agaradhaerens]MCR6105048.1 DUF3147 family protein [Salipaludibacillus agaradhaerens]MCR6116282.1 DUF3147 family protein [Salipaludibacillus agaradhaerens]MCR6117093.1 DUF3147 family protein [Salipaludibacillus agaradhaerens]